MRTIVDLPDEQIGALSKICTQYNISRAEAVRRAVDKLIKELNSEPSNTGFGTWKHKKIDVRKHLDNLRKEWE